MRADQEPTESFVFGGFRLDARSRSLSCNGQKIPLRSRSLEILRVLVAGRGQLVTKGELMSRVWPGVVVGENALQVHVSALRKALGEDVGSQRHIVTVPGQGYRFIEEPAGWQGAASIPLGAAPPLPDKPSIAVLPFENMSGDPEQDYFADGVVEDIITALTRVPSLFVIARNSSFAYKGRSVDIRQVGRELGVRYVLEGSVRKAGVGLRISGQLIQADTGKPPESLDAYDLYLRALADLRGQTRDGADEALRLLEKALILDPTFVTAATLAGVTWALRVNEGRGPAEQAQSEALRYLRLAVRLDPHDAEALAALARFTAMYVRDYEEARSLAERSIALNPNSARVWRSSGWVYLFMGKPSLALDHLQHGLRFNPRDAAAYDSFCGVACALIQLQRDQDALAAARNAIQLKPQYPTALRALASALALVGHVDEARSVVQRLLEVDPNCSLAAMKARFGHTEHAWRRYHEGLREAGLPE